jgi:hypothetical protein
VGDDHGHPGDSAGNPKEGIMGYVMRHGQRIEVTTLNPDPTPRRRRKLFEPEFIRLPLHWIVALRQSRSVNTHRLALLILDETFRDRRRTGEVTLSTKITGMPHESKRRSAEELAKLGLIRLKRKGTRALRAVVVPYIIFK